MKKTLIVLVVAFFAVVLQGGPIQETIEAAAKLSGDGLQGYPNHTNFSLDDPRVTEYSGCLVAILEE